MFTLITEGIQNEKGNYIYERHELTWELKTGDKNLSLKESLKNEFIKKLQEININALVSVKIYPDKLDVWVIFNDNTSLETDLQVNRIFRQLEKQHSSINMSLYMASKDELNDDNVTSF